MSPDRSAADNGLDLMFMPDLSVADLADGVPHLIIAAIVVIVVMLILLPLIGLALELILLIAFFGGGLAGRMLLRRPWVIEAIDRDSPQQSKAFPVIGWRRSRRAIDEIAGAIEASGSPSQLSEPLATESR